MSRNKSGLIVRHVPYEGIAGFREPIETAGYELDRIDVCDPAFASIDLVSPDLVILMGGPMGVYERHAYPWIAHEIERLAERLEYNRPTLGVCFGAQMIVSVLGADVYAGPAKEIGFAPLTLTGAGRKSPLAFLAEVPVLHWHGDTFDLPDGAELLASTPLYPHQAFRRGSNVLALQCHAEMGLDPRIEAWIEQSSPHLAANNLSPKHVRQEYDRLGPACVSAGQSLIQAWLSQIREPAG